MGLFGWLKNQTDLDPPLYFEIKRLLGYFTQKNHKESQENRPTTKMNLTFNSCVGGTSPAGALVERARNWFRCPSWVARGSMRFVPWVSWQLGLGWPKTTIRIQHVPTMKRLYRSEIWKCFKRDWIPGWCLKCSCWPCLLLKSEFLAEIMIGTHLNSLIKRYFPDVTLRRMSFRSCLEVTCGADCVHRKPHGFFNFPKLPKQPDYKWLVPT